MVEISVKSSRDIDNSTSKGDQIKEKVNNVWYKIDSMGYEGLAESISCMLLSHSNIYSFIDYEETNILYKGIVLNGCKSNNFVPDNAELLTAYRLFKHEYGLSPSQVIKEDSLENKIYHFVNSISRITGIEEDTIGKCLSQVLEFDALVLNDDRHFNNLPFLYFDDGHFEIGPVFDNGCALLSDTTFQPIIDNTTEEIEDYILLKEAKPFSQNFYEQISAIRTLFGPQLKINVTIPEIIPENSIYNREILNRCQQTLEYQFDKYPELFVDLNIKETQKLIFEKQFKDCNFRIVLSSGQYKPYIDGRPVSDEELKINYDKAYGILQQVRNSKSIAVGRQIGYGDD